MATRQIVAPGGGAGLKLARGEQLRLIDIEGGQTGDLMAFSSDGRERLSNGRSFDYNGKILLSTGDVLWSDLSNPMLTIVSDDVGRHDFLYASCSIEMYRMQYGVTGYHANCSDNLRAALRERPSAARAIRWYCALRWTWPSPSPRAPRGRATTGRRARSRSR